MTAPRWTVDIHDVDTCLTFSVNGREERICPWTHALWHEQTVTLDSPASFDALVAAVRDADTLRQARERIALWDGEKSTALVIFKELKELLGVDR